jgi:hypothetical protein
VGDKGVEIEGVPPSSCGGPGPGRLLTPEHREQLARAPPRMAAPRGDNHLDHRRRHRVWMGPRRAGSIGERRHAARVIARDPFVPGLPTKAGVLASLGERLLLLQVPGDRLHTFVHGAVSFHGMRAACLRSVTHVPGLICYLCRRSAPK